MRHSLKREFKDASEELRADYEAKKARFSDLEEREKTIFERQSEAGKPFSFEENVFT